MNTEKTALMLLQERVKQSYADTHYDQRIEDLLHDIELLLPTEREQIEDSYKAGFDDGLSTGETSFFNSDFFTQKYKQ